MKNKCKYSRFLLPALAIQGPLKIPFEYGGKGKPKRVGVMGERGLHTMIGPSRKGWGAALVRWEGFISCHGETHVDPQFIRNLDHCKLELNWNC